MLTAIYTAFFAAVALSITVWIVPKLGRLALALVICLLPYGLVRGYQIVGNVRRMMREEQAREHEARIDRELHDVQ